VSGCPEYLLGCLLPLGRKDVIQVIVDLKQLDASQFNRCTASDMPARAHLGTMSLDQWQSQGEERAGTCRPLELRFVLRPPSLKWTL
jgi:hypothetical protein